MMARAHGSRTARAARWAMAASPARAMSAAVPEALEFGKAIVWGKGSLGMRPSEGMQRQLENLSVAPLKPTPLNTLTDQRITDVSPEPGWGLARFSPPQHTTCGAMTAIAGEASRHWCRGFRAPACRDGGAPGDWAGAGAGSAWQRFPSEAFRPRNELPRRP